MRLKMQDRMLAAQMVLLQGAASAQRRLRASISRMRRDERGQTPTEYLMIVGLMAAVIVVVFVNFYWAQIRDTAYQWVEKVKTAVAGTDIH
ncbi:MAG: hypothetical protein HYS05_12865 [Acidobacteria bacterium]|nr:hypothetical protein [Acidobacteriota bacterium]